MSYNVVDQKRGRNSTMLKKINKPKSKETIEEENKRLKKWKTIFEGRIRIQKTNKWYIK